MLAGSATAIAGSGSCGWGVGPAVQAASPKMTAAANADGSRIAGSNDNMFPPLTNKIHQLVIIL